MSNCGKRSYASRNAARAAMKGCQRRRSVELRIYLCDDCYTWHLTGRDEAYVQPKRGRRR
jgi:hypothetical protein